MADIFKRILVYKIVLFWLTIQDPINDPIKNKSA